MWSVNNNIKAGLPSAGTYNRPSAFVKDGILSLLVGDGYSVTNAFQYNDGLTQWETNTPLETFNPSLGSNQFPCVFYYNSNWYNISGNSGGGFTGWLWDSVNEEWISDIISTGLTDIGTSSSPTVFEYNGDLYLIAGTEDGYFYGFKWDGSTWASDSAITTGLSKINIRSQPTVFEIDGTLYLISAFNKYLSGWVFDTQAAAWVADANITIGLPDNSGYYYMRPNAFWYSGTLYIFIGETNGTVLAYEAEIISDKLDIITVEPDESHDCKVTVTTNAAIEAGEQLIVYFADSATGLISPENILAMSTADNITYESIFSLADGTPWYIHVKYLHGENEFTAEANDRFFWVAQKNTTVINITDPTHYINFFDTNPDHKFNHGTIFYNGYIFGSARNKFEVAGGTLSGTGLFKVEAADYTNFSQIEFWENQVTETREIYNLDQIVECSGFLWSVGRANVSGVVVLLRIDPSDLSYMIFGIYSALTSHDYYGQPIGTDGTYLYWCTEDSTVKWDTSLLIDTAANYGYDGTLPVEMPANVEIGSCPAYQPHPTQPAYSHSILIDDLYIWVAFTTGYSTTGYDTDTDTYIYGFQKINKSTMQSLGGVGIPRCTDDMVHNGQYVFLAPEINDNTDDFVGNSYGLIAINKNTLEKKYLKALHADFYTANEADRMGYGVFLFNDYITVQLVTSKKTIVISLANVEQWGENFPIGGATERIYKYQINGTDLALPPNELVLDTSQWVHINTWGEETQLFKFPLTSFEIIAADPVIQTTLISSTDADATVQGAILDTGQSAMSAVGFRYGTDPANLTTNVPATLGDVFTETLLSLTPGVYYIQAWGTNTEGTFYGNIVPFSTYNVLQLAYNSDDAVLNYISKLFGCSIRCVQDAPGVPDGTTGTATDSEGNTYQTIVINEKRWFCSNLKTAKFRTGEDIPEVIPAATWAALNSAGRCKYE